MPEVHSIFMPDDDACVGNIQTLHMREYPDVITRPQLSDNLVIDCL